MMFVRYYCCYSDSGDDGDDDMIWYDMIWLISYWYVRFDMIWYDDYDECKDASNGDDHDHDDDHVFSLQW